MGRGKRLLTAEATELLSLLGLQGSRKGEPKTELVSRSCAAAVDTVRRFEVALRTNSTTREPALTSPRWAGHTCIPSCVSSINNLAETSIVSLPEMLYKSP